MTVKSVILALMSACHVNRFFYFWLSSKIPQTILKTSSNCDELTTTVYYFWRLLLLALETMSVIQMSKNSQNHTIWDLSVLFGIKLHGMNGHHYTKWNSFWEQLQPVPPIIFLLIFTNFTFLLVKKLLRSIILINSLKVEWRRTLGS